MTDTPEPDDRGARPLSLPPNPHAADYTVVRLGTVNRTVHLQPGLLVDLDEHGRVLGIEALGGPVTLDHALTVLRGVPFDLATLAAEFPTAAGEAS